LSPRKIRDSVISQAGLAVFARCVFSELGECQGPGFKNYVFCIVDNSENVCFGMSEIKKHQCFGMSEVKQTCVLECRHSSKRVFWNVGSQANVHFGQSAVEQTCILESRTSSKRVFWNVGRQANVCFGVSVLQISSIFDFIALEKRVCVCVCVCAIPGCFQIPCSQAMHLGILHNSCDAKARFRSTKRIANAMFQISSCRVNAAFPICQIEKLGP
jgi:hypothetical protein